MLAAAASRKALADSSNAAPTPTAVWVVVWIVVGIVVLLLVAWAMWRLRRRWVVHQTAQDAKLLEARVAYSSGDFWRVIRALDPQPWMPRRRRIKTTDIAELLLLSAAYSRVKAAGRAADAFDKASKLLRDEATHKDSLGDIERLTLERWETRQPGGATSTETVDTITNRHDYERKLRSFRIEVEDQVQVADREARLNRRLSLGGGALAAMAATGAGVVGGVGTYHGWERAAIVAPALLSAGLSFVLTTMRPAEIERAAYARAAALRDLIREMRLFEAQDGNSSFGSAELTELFDRWATAEGRPPPVPLTKARQTSSADLGTGHSQTTPQRRFWDRLRGSI